MEKENPQLLRRPRQRYSLEEKEKHLGAQASSGVTVAAYCRQEGLQSFFPALQDLPGEV